MLVRVTQSVSVIILVELFLGGGGRLTAIGPVSLRMVLFSFALLLTLIHFVKGTRIDPKYLYLTGAFTMMLAVGLAVGFILGADRKSMWEDVKPLLFFYLLPFFAIAIRKENDLKMIRKIILFAGGIMAILFLTILFLFLIDAVQFLDFYNISVTTEEFFFRGEFTFFYKGFIYLCIAFLFAHLNEEKKLRWLMGILAIAIALSFTRGLIFALGLTYIVYYALIKKYYVGTLAASVMCFLVLFYGKDLYATASHQLYNITFKNKSPEHAKFNEKLLGDREFSDSERKLQIKQVANATTVPSLLWGHGFGTGIKSRPIHMEISYLEIFHKQGIVGLACWSVILFFLINLYKTGVSEESSIRTAFFLSALFVFFQSLTNQYINNPIGLGMILIAMVCLDVDQSKNLQDNGVRLHGNL